MDNKRRIYLIHKLSRDEWVLPKGGIEEGESALETAEREIKEETGYQNIEALKPKPFKTSTWVFIPKDNDTKEQKTVNYFLFRLTGEIQTKTPEIAAEGLEGSWFSFEEALEKVSFDNLKGVIKAAGRELELAPHRGRRSEVLYGYRGLHQVSKFGSDRM